MFGVLLADLPGGDQGQGHVGGDLREPHDERDNRALVPEHVRRHDDGGVFLLLRGAVGYIGLLLLFHGESVRARLVRVPCKPDRFPCDGQRCRLLSGGGGGVAASFAAARPLSLSLSVTLGGLIARSLSISIPIKLCLTAEQQLTALLFFSTNRHSAVYCISNL